MKAEEGGMIELTESQRQSLQKPNGEPARVVDPATKQEYVLLKLEDYQELLQGAYDDSRWTDEEMDLLAGEVDAKLDDDMATRWARPWDL
jgi:hypothetical protein